MKKQLNQYSEYELLVLLKEGSEPAFSELFKRFEQKIYLYALKFTHNKLTAEEMVQDVFVKLWEYRENIDLALPFSALLFKITKNNVLNHLRGESRQLAARKSGEAPMGAVRNIIEDKIIFDEYIQIADRAISLLPPQRRSIFKMSRYEGKTYDEIAAALGISKDTVRVQMVKSLKTIREFMLVHADVTVSIWLCFLGGIIF
jgi:RNA polymerase sigma-70 factor (family 1)